MPKQWSIEALVERLERLEAQNVELLALTQQQQRTIESQRREIESLLKRLYGKSSERLDPLQTLMEPVLLGSLGVVVPEPVALPVAVRREEPRKRSCGRQTLPAHLVRQDIVHDLPESQKQCARCGAPKACIGQDVTERLDYAPASLNVKRHVRLKYACRCAECAELGVQTAEKSREPIEKCLAAPGLLAHVAVSKYHDHVPLYRLEGILGREGVELGRGTMCGWMRGVSEVLTPLYELMIKLVLACGYVHTDDTPVDMLDPGRGQTKQTRIWVCVGTGEAPYVVYDFTEGRGQDGPLRFFSRYKGFIQADAYGGYDALFRLPGIAEVACWAHTRRYFHEALPTAAKEATEALALIQLLYRIEAELELEKADADRILEVRQHRSVPLLGEFRRWMDALSAGGGVLPKSPLGKATYYAHHQWAALQVYTTDGRLRIDNNPAENALRPVALGRKNWLFFGSQEGGRTAAILTSFMITCRNLKIEPWAYLSDVLARISDHPMKSLGELLPDCWQAARVATAPVPVPAV